MLKSTTKIIYVYIYSPGSRYECGWAYGRVRWGGLLATWSLLLAITRVTRNQYRTISVSVPESESVLLVIVESFFFSRVSNV